MLSEDANNRTLLLIADVDMYCTYVNTVELYCQIFGMRSYDGGSTILRLSLCSMSESQMFQKMNSSNISVYFIMLIKIFSTVVSLNDETSFILFV